MRYAGMLRYGVVFGAAQNVLAVLVLCAMGRQS